MLASVVIPTFNRSGFLLETVKNLIQQEAPYYELIVVDQSDELDSVVKNLETPGQVDLRYFHVSFRGLPAARNFGAAKARAKVIIFVDDDINCGRDFVNQHLQAHRKTGAGIIAGGIIEHRDVNVRPDLMGKFNHWTADAYPGFNSKHGKPVDHAKGCNFSVHKAVFKRIEGFDKRFGKGAALYEELDFCLRAGRAGVSLYFYPQAHLHHLLALRQARQWFDKDKSSHAMRVMINAWNEGYREGGKPPDTGL